MRALWFLLLLPAAAQAQAPEKLSPAVEFAARAGAMTGAADFCRIDWPLIQDVTEMANWNLRRLATSGKDMGRASGVFLQLARQHAGSGPKAGCEGYPERFEAFRAELKAQVSAAGRDGASRP